MTGNVKWFNNEKALASSPSKTARMCSCITLPSRAMGSKPSKKVRLSNLTSLPANAAIRRQMLSSSDQAAENEDTPAGPFVDLAGVRRFYGSFSSK